MSDAEANIADLAKESKQKDASSRIPPIPLVILAPLLVIVALIAVAVPSSIVLNKASSDTTDLLSAEYLNALSANVKVQIEEAARRLEPLVEGIMRNPGIDKTMTGNLKNLQYSDAVAPLVTMGSSYGLASLACYTAHWKPGFDKTYPLNNTRYQWLGSVNFAIMQYVFVNNVGFIGITEPGVEEYYNATLNMNYTMQTGYTYFPFAPVSKYYGFAPFTLTDPGRIFPTTQNLTFTYAIEPTLFPAALQMLGLQTPIFNVSEFSIAYFQNGWTVGYIQRSNFPYNDPTALPTYSCAAGMRVDDQWNDLLRRLKPPVANSVVAVYTQELITVASSNMVVDDSVLTGGNQFNKAKPDAFTNSVLDHIKTLYPTGAAALADIGTGKRINANIQGERWILNTAVIEMTARPQDRYLLVAAVPHHEIYGTIDSAKKRGLGLSIGIAVGMASLIAVIFVLITLPLANLAKQMAQLTKLDFASLESSGQLERRSFILELRKVQVVFATMVRAFAGAIKKNKQMAGGANTGATSSRGGGTTNPNASAQILRTTKS